MKIDLIALGDPMMDVLSRCDDNILKSLNVEKGAMRLISKSEANALLAVLPDQKIMPGGSAANSMAGIGVLGGTARFVGKLANDDLGDAFVSDFNSIPGIIFSTSRLIDLEGTAFSAILVSDDGERTMSTYLGASAHLSVEDVIEDEVQQAKVLFVEAYLWDHARTRDAALKAINIAKASDLKVAITLSDRDCVLRHLPDLKYLIQSGDVDLVLANEHELKALYSTHSIDDAVATAASTSSSFAVTLGAKGAVAIENGELCYVAAKRVAKIVDLVGAGDAFAAGVLLGYSRNNKLAQAAVDGCEYAARIIQTQGARL